MPVKRSRSKLLEIIKWVSYKSLFVGILSYLWLLGKVLVLLDLGFTQKEVEVTPRTVKRVAKRVRELGKAQLKGKVGRKRKSTEEQHNLMMDLVEEDPFRSVSQVKQAAMGRLNNLSVRLKSTAGTRGTPA